MLNIPSKSAGSWIAKRSWCALNGIENNKGVKQIALKIHHASTTTKTQVAYGNSHLGCK